MRRFYNPYTCGDPVGPPHFYGRYDIIKRIQQWPTRTIHIVGMRRIGKSSLYYKLAETLPVARVNGEIIQGSPERLHQLFIEVFEDQQEEEGWEWLPEPDNYRDFRTLLRKMDRAIAKRGKELWLFWDEAEGLLSLEQKHPEALSLLRDVIWNSRALRVMFISAKTLSELSIPSSSLKTSPFINNLPPPLYLGMLTDPEALNLVWQVQTLPHPFAVPLKVAQSILHYAGNHPYYIQHLCYQLWEQEPNPEKWPLITDFPLTPQLVGFLKQDYEYLSPHEKRILQMVARKQQPTAQDQGYLQALDSLGYLRLEQNQYVLGNKFLESWLRSPNMEWTLPSETTDRNSIAMYAKTEADYQAVALSEFLTQHFKTINDLRFLCYDAKHLSRLIYPKLDRAMPRHAIINQLVTSAKKQGLLHHLAAELRQITPQAYHDFFSLP